MLDYIYAVLHSPSYRERYKEFLKIDFPRIPYPQDAAQFWALSALGAKLRRLHLMENVEPLSGMAIYPKDGDNRIEKLSCENDKVWINDAQYFDNVPPEAWNFYIGGYQPAQKWLKDRKGRALNYDDIRHYQRIIRILKETGDIQKMIDEINN
jgi:predicted helicase